MPRELSEEMLEGLAYERGFHQGDMPRGLTRAPLDALRASLRPGMRTLETGCGGSTVVFAAAGARHTVITPDPSEADGVRDYCERNDIPHDDIDFVIASSDRALVDWNEELDVVLIDGAHRLPFPMLDWHYTAPWMRVGGRVFLDDVAIPAVHLLYQFLRGEDEWRLLGIPGDKTAVFEQVEKLDPAPDSDWEAQRYNRYWRYGHIPPSRRWRTLRAQAAIGTRLRRLLGRET